jgi:hypothetical protein
MNNKKTILVLASRMVPFCLLLFLKERYEYWFIFYIHCLIFKALIEYHSILSQFYFNFGKSCEIEMNYVKL